MEILEIPEPDQTSLDVLRLISEIISKIGDNLDRTLEIIQRIERKLT
jgi:hypothetical protein